MRPSHTLRGREGGRRTWLGPWRSTLAKQSGSGVGWERAPPISEAALGHLSHGSTTAPRKAAARHCSLWPPVSGASARGCSRKGPSARLSWCLQPLEHGTSGKRASRPGAPRSHHSWPRIPLFLPETLSRAAPGGPWPGALPPWPGDAGLHGHSGERPVCGARGRLCFLSGRCLCGLPLCCGGGCLRTRIIWGLQREALSRHLPLPGHAIARPVRSLPPRSLLPPPAWAILLRTHMSLRSSFSLSRIPSVSVISC